MSAYAAYYLVLSLIEKAGADPDDIIVRYVPDSSAKIIEDFQKLGVRTNPVANESRLCQTEQVSVAETDYLVLMDPNTVVVDSLNGYFNDDCIAVSMAAGVDPAQNVLKTILGGLRTSNCDARLNGLPDFQFGFFGIPGALLKDFLPIWKKQAARLLEQGKTLNADFTSFFLAIHAGGVRFEVSPSNANYPLEEEPSQIGFNRSDVIRAIRYKHSNINIVGNLECRPHSFGSEAVSVANELIRRHYNNHLFWNFRYENFPERGSGVGSRGEIAEYKRELFRKEGIESAQSVLDFGCGDLEVLKPLKISHYLGLDQSESALEKARVARPDWNFRQLTRFDDPASLPESEIVICMEVLIHQTKEEDYRRIIDIISSKCGSTLFVSGYETPTPSISTNHMLAFYEPLSESLRKTGRFNQIRVIGCHSEFVYVLRCDRSASS